MDFGPSFLERGRVYAIGDIHGRSDLLDRIVTAIRSDLEANPVENCVTVTLGDYFDRGPDSRGVILDLLKHCPVPAEKSTHRIRHPLSSGYGCRINFSGDEPGVDRGSIAIDAI